MGDTMDMDSDTMARGLLSPRPRLIPTTLVDTMVDMVLAMPTTDMALDTMDMDSDTTARGLLRLSPRPRLIPTTLEDTMVDMDSDTTARGLLRLSLRPRLIPTTLVDTMVDMVLDMAAMDMALDTTDMVLDTMARGLLMLRLIPTTMVDTMVDMAMDTMADIDMVLATTAMDVIFMATTDKSTNPYLFPDLLQTRDLIKYQDLSVNQVLSPCHQNGLYHSSSPHECCQFQCCASLVSLEMASRKQRIKML